MLDYEARSNINYSVIFGPNGFNERSNEKYWQRFSDYICIPMHLLRLFYSQQNYTFRRQNLDQICPLLWELLDQLSIGHIDSHQLKTQNIY